MGNVCALKTCCGRDLHTGTRICMIYVLITSLICAVLVLMDLVDLESDIFAISGTFPTEWRIHINDVMRALDVVMIFAHLFMFGLSIILMLVTRSEDTQLNVCVLVFYTVMMSLYIAIEFAVNIYFFTWMNHNIFVLPYICFLWGFWIVRFCANIFVAVITHSRVVDLKFEKRYDLLNMPGVGHSLSKASTLAGSMRSVRGQEHIRSLSQSRLAASRQSLSGSRNYVSRSQQSLNRSANYR